MTGKNEKGDNMVEKIREEIERLKREKDVVILAHYYVDGDVQALADIVGDSYFLAKKATEISQKNILFCGVNFMGESAKLLNPDKRVIMPVADADCPMAHMADISCMEQVRAEYPDVAVVCYVNSTAEIKAHSDVCVTSSNALRVVKALPNEHIFFVPDENLARYVANQIPEKHFIFNDGYCHVHKEIQKEDVLRAKEAHPGAPVLTHPECTEDVLKISDFIGSTSEILKYASASAGKEFIICTELGIFYELVLKNPEKQFYSVKEQQICPNMKKISMENVLEALQNLEPVVELDEELCEKAKAPLVKMLELAK